MKGSSSIIQFGVEQHEYEYLNILNKKWKTCEIIAYLKMMSSDENFYAQIEREQSNWSNNISEIVKSIKMIAVIG